MTPNITIYMNRICTNCETKGASVHGLCLYCTTQQIKKETVDPRSFVNTWVKKGANHTIEHYVVSLADGKYKFACEKYVRVGEVVAGTGIQNLVYQCGACSDAVGVKHEFG